MLSKFRFARGYLLGLAVQLFALPRQCGFALVERGMLLMECRFLLLDLACSSNLLVACSFAPQLQLPTFAVEVSPLSGELTARIVELALGSLEGSAFGANFLLEVRFASGSRRNAAIQFCGSLSQCGFALRLPRVHLARLGCLLVRDFMFAPQALGSSRQGLSVLGELSAGALQ